MLQAYVPSAHARDRLPSGGACAEAVPRTVEPAPGDRIGTSRAGERPRRFGALPVRISVAQRFLSHVRNPDVREQRVSGRVGGWILGECAAAAGPRRTGAAVALVPEREYLARRHQTTNAVKNRKHDPNYQSVLIWVFRSITMNCQLLFIYLFIMSYLLKTTQSLFSLGLLHNTETNVNVMLIVDQYTCFYVSELKRKSNTTLRRLFFTHFLYNYLCLLWNTYLVAASVWYLVWFTYFVLVS